MRISYRQIKRHSFLLAGLLLLSGLFCSCEKEPEVTNCYSISYNTKIEEGSVDYHYDPTLELYRLRIQLATDLYKLTQYQSWEVPTTKGHINDGNSDAIAEFYNRLQTETVRLISTYKDAPPSYEFKDKEHFTITIDCSLVKSVKTADLESIQTVIAKRGIVLIFNRLGSIWTYIYYE